MRTVAVVEVPELVVVAGGGVVVVGGADVVVGSADVVVGGGGGAAWSKTALTEVAEPAANAQVGLVEQTPRHRTNVDPWSAVAVSVTFC